jgi:6-pyruvoyltetrahydropterin/6-carboxytetrahydropterin synthase
MKIYKEFTFEAAHHLPEQFAEGHPNHRIHGHSFRVRVTLRGNPDPQTGLIAELGSVAEALQALHQELDHRYLNKDVPGLDNPTLENITLWIWNRLAPVFPGLDEVSVHRDTCREGCVYTGNS